MKVDVGVVEMREQVLGMMSILAAVAVTVVVVEWHILRCGSTGGSLYGVQGLEYGEAMKHAGSAVRAWIQSNISLVFGKLRVEWSGWRRSWDGLLRSLGSGSACPDSQGGDVEREVRAREVARMVYSLRLALNLCSVGQVEWIIRSV